MSDNKFSFTGSFQKIKEYIDTQVDLIKLKVLAKSSRILSSLVLDITKVLLVLMMIFFFSLALGFWLSELLDSFSLGFLATGGIFLIILLLVGLLEPKLEAKIMDITIKKVIRKWSQDDDEGSESNTFNSSSATGDGDNSAEQKVDNERTY